MNNQDKTEKEERAFPTFEEGVVAFQIVSSLLESEANNIFQIPALQTQSKKAQSNNNLSYNICPHCNGSGQIKNETLDKKSTFYFFYLISTYIFTLFNIII